MHPSAHGSLLRHDKSSGKQSERNETGQFFDTSTHASSVALWHGEKNQYNKTESMHTSGEPTSTYTPFNFNTPTENHSSEQQTSLPARPELVEGWRQQTHDFHLIGQYNKTYLLIEQPDGLFVIDQHAAHERILYERFGARFEEITTASLLFPQLIPLSPHDIITLEAYLPLLQQLGIQSEQFGTNQLKINSLPIAIKDINIRELLEQVIGWIHESSNVDTQLLTKTIHEKLRAQMACKAAVKAGDMLTQEQMKQLLVDLHNSDNRLTCPHGRPTGWLLSLHEVEKKFKRKT